MYRYIAAVPLDGGGAALYRLPFSGVDGENTNAAMVDVSCTPEMIARIPPPPPPLPLPEAHARASIGAAAAAAAAAADDDDDDDADDDDDDDDDEKSDDGEESDRDNGGSVVGDESRWRSASSSFECMCPLPGGGVVRVWGDDFRGAHGRAVTVTS